MTQNLENIIISHSGSLNFETVNGLLDRLQYKLSLGSANTLCKKRIYSTAVETLENILRHSNINDFNEPPPRFKVSHKKDGYEVESCNTVTLNQKKNLQEKIDFINNNAEIINKIFAEKLRTTEISDEGGAGLGVYIIGKNASGKICYSFQDINEKQSYFCLKIKI